MIHNIFPGTTDGACLVRRGLVMCLWFFSRRVSRPGPSNLGLPPLEHLNRTPKVFARSSVSRDSSYPAPVRSRSVALSRAGPRKPMPAGRLTQALMTICSVISLSNETKRGLPDSELLLRPKSILAPCCLAGSNIATNTFRGRKFTRTWQTPKRLTLDFTASGNF